MHIFVDRQNLETNGDENTAMASLPNSSSISVDGQKVENISHNNNFSNVSIQPINPSYSANNVQASYDKCWKGYSNYNYLWIITGPMTLVIFVRYILIHIPHLNFTIFY